MRIAFGLIGLSAAILIAGCQANLLRPEPTLEATADTGVTPPFAPGPASPTPRATITVPSTPISAASGTERLVEMAREDLSQRLAIPMTQINLLEVTEAEWSDSSLDCPQPGMAYLQVITPGYRILLEVNGTPYEYHSNRDAYIVYCENSFPLIPPPKP